MAMLDGKEYASWDDYFHDKLPGEFLLADRDPSQPGSPIRVRSKLMNCDTQLLIEFPGEDTCMVTCSNTSSLLNMAGLQTDVLTNALFESFYEFNDISLDQLDNQLNIPLYFGWTDQLNYYKGKLVEAQLAFRDQAGWHTLPILKNRSWLDNAGCLLMLFTWPVLYIQHQAVLFFYRRNIRTINRKEHINQPMAGAV